MNGIPENQMSEFAPDVIALIGTGSVKVIQLTQGKVAIVDAEDYEWLSKYKWFAHKHRYTFYPTRRMRGNKKWAHSKMHREILNLSAGDGIIVDHKNQNGLDCRRVNLRIATPSLNAYNCRKRIDNVSGHRGVSWDNTWKHWVAQIAKEGRQIWLGSHKNILDAAKAYDKAAIKYYGENAILNFPDNVDEYADRILERI